MAGREKLLYHFKGNFSEAGHGRTLLILASEEHAKNMLIVTSWNMIVLL